MKNKGIVLIPFSNTNDVDNFARKYNLQDKYSGMFLHQTDKNHPNKFIIIIEDWNFEDIPKEIWKSFNQKDGGVYYFERKEDLNNFRKHFYPSCLYLPKQVPLNKGWLLVSTEISSPTFVHI